MKKQLPTLRALTGVEGVYTSQIGKLRCTVLRLRDGGLCLYSPVAGLDDAVRASLQELGDVRFLLAPNHYHNKGLSEYQISFPDADIICSEAALPRLSKVTGLEFGGLEGLAARLPDNVQILEPEGLKTGEVWFEIRNEAEVVWIVTDAFTSASIASNEYAQEPSMLGTFPKYGVRDGDAFKSWVQAQVSYQAPTILVPCHGAPVAHPNLGKALVKLLDDLA